MDTVASPRWGLIDIHCHLLPHLDDGAKSWPESLAMAQVAAGDGIRAMIVTPHQLGAFARNGGDLIRSETRRMQQHLDRHDVPLKVLPGADVRIEPDLVARIARGEVLTLGDHRRHVLLELPHDLCFPLTPLLQELAAQGMVGILSHPERNLGLLAEPHLIRELVEAGCLMQITAGSLEGSFGDARRLLAEWMLRRGLVHFVASDAHGHKTRRPQLSQAREHVLQLTDEQTAEDLFCNFPSAVFQGNAVPAGSRTMVQPRVRRPWFRWTKAG
jgi:protein-tyrosine phosphatase